ncbi:MAG: glutathione S-transferase [Alphaproteobacteria bacterium]|nr:glutathione S-transferase [Alphaproteobacteria bacterium]
MYQLYYAPGTCSMAIHIILNELNQPVELKKVDLSAPRPAEFLKVNPRGAVPALIDDGHVIREGGAIISYLLDKHNSPMLPKNGKERATALEWLMFANATMHPAYARGFFILKNVSDAAQKDALMKVAIESVEKLWVEVDERLAKQPYVCGNECTGLIIMLARHAIGEIILARETIFGVVVIFIIRAVADFFHQLGGSI